MNNNNKYLKKLIEPKPRYQMPLLLQNKIRNATSQYKNYSNQSSHLDYESLHTEIRQNQLNSKFLRRKKRLENISVQNKHIYEKINTQKSFYGNQDLNKSYRSTSEISKRLSRLRERSRQNSMSRISRENSAKYKLIKPPIRAKPPMICQTINVKSIKQDNINHLKSLFYIQKQNRQLTMKSNTVSLSKNERKSTKQSNKHHQKYKLPYLSEYNTKILTQNNLNKFYEQNLKKDIESKFIFQNSQRRASLFDKKLRELLSN